MPDLVLLSLPLSSPLHVRTSDGDPDDAIDLVHRALASSPFVPHLSVRDPHARSRVIATSLDETTAAARACWCKDGSVHLSSSEDSPGWNLKLTPQLLSVIRTLPVPSLDALVDDLTSLAVALIASLGSGRLRGSPRLTFLSDPRIALPLPARQGVRLDLGSLVDIIAPRAFAMSSDPPDVFEALRDDPLPAGASRTLVDDLVVVRWCDRPDDARERQRSLVRRALWLARRFGGEHDASLDEHGNQHLRFLPPLPWASPLLAGDPEMGSVLLVDEPTDEALVQALRLADRSKTRGRLLITAPDRVAAEALRQVAQRHRIKDIHFLDAPPANSSLTGKALRRLAPAGAWWKLGGSYVDPPYSMAEVDPGPVSRTSSPPAPATLMPLARLCWSRKLAKEDILPTLRRVLDALPPWDGIAWTSDSEPALRGASGEPPALRDGRHQLLTTGGMTIVRASHPALGPYRDTALHVGLFHSGALDLAVLDSTSAQLDRDWQLVTSLAATLAPALGAVRAHAWVTRPRSFTEKLTPGRSRPKAGLPPVLAPWNWLGAPHTELTTRDALARLPGSHVADHEGGLLVTLGDEPLAPALDELRTALGGLGVVVLPVAT